MTIHYDGLTLSPIAQQNYKQLIHLELNNNLNEILNKKNKKELFQIIQNKYIKAYVDPSQLSYHSFENILNLDQKLKDIQISFQNIKYYNRYYKFDIIDHKKSLMKLNDLNLYTLPLNNKSRGGKRMIFSSINLSQQLTKNINNLEYIGQKLKNQFNSINHVFRLNNFSPEDNKFQSHYDTPFSDQKRKLYSRYTLLIYLTGGTNNNNSCLKIKDTQITQIKAYTGIIFDQKYQHQGYPFTNCDKIFMRTQLIYHLPFLNKNQTVSYFFNKACYFTKQSIYDEQLQKYSSQLFNHTAKLRYSLKSKIYDKYLIKKNYNVVYITNGQCFWFRDKYQLKFIVKLVLIDYFNAKINKKITSKQYKMGTKDDQGIIFCLDNLSFDQDKPYNMNNDFNQIISQQQYSNINITKYRCGICDSIEQSNRSEPYEQQARQISLRKLYQKIDDLSVVLFNGQVFINNNNIIIEDKQIKFNDAYFNKTINFASCQCQAYSPKQFITKQHNNLQGFLLPNIKYLKIKDGYKLSIDIFNNGFIHKVKTKFSKPSIVQPPIKNQYQQPFYDENQQYIDSDQQCSSNQSNQSISQQDSQIQSQMNQQQQNKNNKQQQNY